MWIQEWLLRVTTKPEESSENTSAEPKENLNQAPERSTEIDENVRLESNFVAAENILSDTTRDLPEGVLDELKREAQQENNPNFLLTGASHTAKMRNMFAHMREKR